MSPMLDFYEDELLAETLLSSEASSSSRPTVDGRAALSTDYLYSYNTATLRELLEKSLQDESSEILSVIGNCNNPSFITPAGEKYICEQQQKHHNFDQIFFTYPDSLESSTASAITYFPEIYEESPLQLPTSHMSFNQSQTCSFMDSNSFYAASSESTGLFGGGMMVGVDTGITTQELVQSQMSDNGRAGAYKMDTNTTYSYSNEVIGDNQQYLMGSSCTINAPLDYAETPAVDEQTFKVGKLSTEQRKEKINRYMKKRSKRNFSKKIKYACRKTLADSRPRVRGRFAKNDELGDILRSSSDHHDYEDYNMAIKEEGLLDSLDILEHISGLTSFKYNNSLESCI